MYFRIHFMQLPLTIKRICDGILLDNIKVSDLKFINQYYRMRDETKEPKEGF